MAKKSSKKSGPKKAVTYYYNPFYKNDEELQFLEVWQVLEDDVLGSLYPWQYVNSAETSNRIVTLNFLALKNFENDYKVYYDQMFMYKVSAKLLSEGNVHRLGSILQPNLILCFDIYQLEKFGDRAAIAGLNFLANIGATIMISGVDRAPVDILLKYPTTYFLLDYRYYTSQNKGVITMLKNIADQGNITLVVGNVNSRDNLSIFKDNGVEIYAGSALVRPKRKIDSLITDSNVDAGDMVEDRKSFIVSAKDAPQIKDKEKKEETVIIDITSQAEELKLRLAASARAKKQAQEEEAKRKALEEEKLRKEQEEKERELQRLKNEEAKRLAQKLGAGQLTTSMEEFASLSKDTTKKETKRGANVIKLNVSTPPKKKKK